MAPPRAHEPLPRRFVRPPVDLEPLIPAFDEQRRLPSTIAATVDYIGERSWSSAVVADTQCGFTFLSGPLARAIARRFAAAGARVTLVSSRYPGSRALEYRDGIRVVRGGGTFGGYGAAAAHLPRNRHAYDAVVDFQNHQHRFDTRFRRPMNAVGRLLEKQVSRRAYRGRPVVVVSPSTREGARRELGFGNTHRIVPTVTFHGHVTEEREQELFHQAWLTVVPSEVLAEARHEPAREGWSTGGSRALATAVAAMARLDRGEPVPLPLPLPAATSLRVGAEPAGRLLDEGRLRTASREASRRVPLVMAERPRRRVS